MAGPPGGGGADLLIRRVRLGTDPSPDEVDLRIADGRIAAVRPSGGAGEATPSDLPVLEGRGRTAIPGLIDIHVHGAGGADLLDGTPEAVRTMAAALARTGTTAFVAAASPRAPDGGEAHLRVAAELAGEPLEGATLLGLHLEGPFINPARRGGLPEAAVEGPSRKVLDRIFGAAGDALRIMTVAPEVSGTLPLVAAMVERAVVPSFGHTAANHDETVAGFEAGIRHVTHLYNAMPALHHREPGPLPAILSREDVTVELITDGVHVDHRVVAWTRRIVGEHRLACITDGVRAVGLPEGRYRYGGRPFEAKDGTARYLDGTLIGTAVGMREILRRFRRYTGCDLPEALRACAAVPARILGLDERKGSLDEGKDADIVLLDDSEDGAGAGEVRATVVGGRVVYRAG